MLPKKDYLDKFENLQKLTIEATNLLIKWISPGASEKEIADKYYSLLSNAGFDEHWYPILIYTSEITSKPISRRIHLPSEDIKVKENDIIFVDSTPMKGTVWSNWCDTIAIGENEFYKELISDVKEIVDITATFANTETSTVGNLLNFSSNLSSIASSIVIPIKSFMASRSF